jgi:hypothetical protein
MSNYKSRENLVPNFQSLKSTISYYGQVQDSYREFSELDLKRI